MGQKFYFQRDILSYSLDNGFVCLFYILYDSHQEGSDVSSEYNLTKLILQIERPSYDLTSERISPNSEALNANT